MPDGDDAGLSAYELERLANMRRNAAHLESLGLESRAPGGVPARRPAGGSSGKSRARPLPPPPAARRSSLVARASQAAGDRKRKGATSQVCASSDALARSQRRHSKHER